MREKIPVNSDIMRNICSDLSKPGVLKNWKHLAIKLGMKYHEYKVYDVKAQIDPTRHLLEWKVAEQPDLKVTELCKKLREIHRNDVIDEIERAYCCRFIL